MAHHRIAVTAIDQEGHRVRVGPADPTTADVLEYAALLIETEGWNQRSVTGAESSVQNGWTLHDSIGEACTRLSASPGLERGNKDASYMNAEGRSVSLRTGAQTAVDAELQRRIDAGEWDGQGGGTEGRIDYRFNDDPATTQDAVLDVLRAAREAA